MFFSKSCEYALRATLYIAKNGNIQKVGIRVIAEDLDVPMHYLSKVMQILVKQKIISSVKGRNGGFYLTESEINKPLIRIVHAIDGEDIFRKCALGIKNCSSKQPCPLHYDIKDYRDNLMKALSSNSIGSKVNSATFLSK